MTKKKDPLEPRVEGKVSMYVCGVTPYDFSHAGHARAYVAFDVLNRYLKFLGYEVQYVRNFTDIDDKIIKRANQAGETVTSLSGWFIKEFLADMAELQCLPSTCEPRVTEHIEHIIELIAKALDAKVIIFKKKRRKNYRRTKGHRQRWAQSIIHVLKERHTRPLVCFILKVDSRVSSEAKCYSSLSSCWF